MPWAPDYCSAAELKSYISPSISDTVDDAELGFAITAASRAIDHYTGRQFGVLSSAAARYYTPTSRGRSAVVIDDLMTTTDLVVKVDDDNDGVYETTLVLGTDVAMFPWNASADSRPWTMIVAESGAGHVFPCRDRSVEVTAKWGWTAVPTEVKQAALLQASRIFTRRNAPFGIAGSPELGSEMRLLSKVDPDVAVVLSGVRRYDRGIA